MFAKITSQVREQRRCLLTILLILQTDSSGVFFAAHSFPRQLQIERNKVLGIFHSCLSNPTGWCWNCKDSWKNEYPHTGTVSRSRPLLTCLFWGTTLVLFFFSTREPSLPTFHILTYVARCSEDPTVTKLSRPSHWAQPDEFKERQGAANVLRAKADQQQA